MSNKINLLVLRGGPSAERDVSLASGTAVAAACRRLGYSVTEADIGPRDLQALGCQADIIFPVLHGPFGEDGTLQAILEERGLYYVGSDAAASRLAIDKNASKHTWQQAGLPTAPWCMVDGNVSKMPGILPAGLVPPIVVKPLTEGSSIGVYLCETWDNLQDAIAKTVSNHGKVLIEKRLVGPEITVGILENVALPVIQIQTASGFYDYDAKYQRNDTTYLLEPKLDAVTYQLVQDLALRAFHALGCRDFARVDLIVDENLGPQLLEINTIPGFTSHSLLPKAAAHVGIDFDTLVDRLIKMALRRRDGDK